MNIRYAAKTVAIVAVWGIPACAAYLLNSPGICWGWLLSYEISKWIVEWSER
jgi:hypothetical protein